MPDEFTQECFSETDKHYRLLCRSVSFHFIPGFERSIIFDVMRTERDHATSWERRLPSSQWDRYTYVSTSLQDGGLGETVHPHQHRRLHAHRTSLRLNCMRDRHAP